MQVQVVDSERMFVAFAGNSLGWAVVDLAAGLEEPVASPETMTVPLEATNSRMVEVAAEEVETCAAAVAVVVVPREDDSEAAVEVVEKALSILKSSRMLEINKRPVSQI